MMFGNVAPAPLSCTCAAAGAAAPSRAARARQRVVFTAGVLGSGSGSEYELRLNQRLIGSRPAALRLHAIEVGEHTDVRAQLVRRAGDDPRIAIVGGVLVRIHNVHASDDGDLAGGEVIDAKDADDAASGCILHGHIIARDSELLCAIGELTQIAIAVGASSGLADPGVPSDPETADATVVVRGLDAHRDAGLDILPEVAGAAAIALPVHDDELAIHLLP